MNRDQALTKAADDACLEARLACKSWKPFNSSHEGYAVILEEMDELWDEIKKKQPNKDQLKHEAVQAAAMLLRFIAEL